MLWQTFLALVCVKIPRTADFSKVVLIVELKKLVLLRTKNLISVESAASSVKFLRPSDQMAASIQFYQFLAKTSTSVNIAPIG
jgi:hypothetical protein